MAERDVLKRDNAQLEREVRELRELLNEFRASNREMRAGTAARYHMEEELAELHRERQIARAREAERQPGQLLH